MVLGLHLPQCKWDEDLCLSDFDAVGLGDIGEPLGDFVAESAAEGGRGVEEEVGVVVDLSTAHEEGRGFQFGGCRTGCRAGVFGFECHAVDGVAKLWWEGEEFGWLVTLLGSLSKNHDLRHAAVGDC